ncbi:beta-galactosidase [Persicobacter diffluens]|uniref:Beta-galactosidase n=2 Tax=Persicobacter diffluens TaxID=981 RepID=A0AAN5ALD7_9BACT|nr:beta-galactosidase [Persicobacter diffluens]
MEKKVYLFIFFLLSWPAILSAQIGRQSMNSGWYFQRADQEAAELVNLPHHYNEDAYTTSKYFRGRAVYSKNLTFQLKAGKDYELEFEGVNSQAEVYLNEVLVGSHQGGYTSFFVPLNKALNFQGENQLKVVVENTNKDIPPLNGDFSIFGGIYRSVWLHELAPVHFLHDTYGGKGVQLVTTHLEGGSLEAQLNVKVASKMKSGKMRLAFELLDEGQMIFSRNYSFKAHQGIIDRNWDLPTINGITLWSPEQPKRYTVKVRLLDAKGEVYDSFETKTGFRTIAIGPSNELILNGKPLKLMGASRHQDRGRAGIALSAKQHQQDIKIMKEMGANFVRLGHYPQSSAVLEACDALGLLVWEEIPMVDILGNNEIFKENTRQALKEMVAQHRHHPSIIIWGLMNEPIIQVPYRIKGKEAQQAHYRATKEFGEELQQICKGLDASRFTAMAFHGSQLYNEIGIAEVPDIVGWNLYQGWYGEHMEDFEQFIEKENQKYPDRPMIISEFGAGGDRRLHSTQAEAFDFSIEYQQELLAYYLPIIQEKDYLMGGAIWNQFDFSSALRQESMPHINNKGLCYADRSPKDVYYLAQALMSKEPVLHLAVHDWSNRVIWPQDSVQEIKVFSNLPEVDLYLNQEFVGSQKVQGGVAKWQLPLAEGPQQLEVRAEQKSISKKAELNIRYVKCDSGKLPWNGIGINAGSTAYYHSSEDDFAWLADYPEQEGMGHQGGEPYKRGRRKGTTAAIKGTIHDPLYQTKRIGEFSYYFDLPAGQYELRLLFADLQFHGPPLAYDLHAQKDSSGKVGNMNVLLNGEPLLQDFSPSAQVGGNFALEKIFNVQIGEPGLLLEFKPNKGSAFVNALQLYPK